nr:MAG TPA: hypothetical protein [Caudoviricetes sp.]
MDIILIQRQNMLGNIYLKRRKRKLDRKPYVEKYPKKPLKKLD